MINTQFENEFDDLPEQTHHHGSDHSPEQLLSRREHRLPAWGCSGDRGRDKETETLPCQTGPVDQAPLGSTWVHSLGSPSDTVQVDWAILVQRSVTVLGQNGALFWFQLTTAHFKLMLLKTWVWRLELLTTL